VQITCKILQNRIASFTRVCYKATQTHTHTHSHTCMAVITSILNKTPTRCTISLKVFKIYLHIHCSTCFGHHCAHHQEPPITAIQSLVTVWCWVALFTLSFFCVNSQFICTIPKWISRSPLSSGMWQCGGWHLVTDVLGQPTFLIFKGKLSAVERGTDRLSSNSWTAWPFSWDRYAVQKHRLLTTSLGRVTLQKSEGLSYAATRTRLLA
jgi:hypothetical protein